MSASAPRRRRSAEASRRRILEAAGGLLAEAGPEGLRLQELARRLDISHPTILHHFGSREGLMRALAVHSAEALNRELRERVASGAPDVAEVLEHAARTLGDRGQARLLAWLVLSGREPDAEAAPRVLADLAEQVHALHRARRAEQGGAPAPYEEALFTVLLGGLALLGDALVGDVLRRSAGLGDDPDAPRRFRAWLGERLRQHMVHAGETTDPAGA